MPVMPFLNPNEGAGDNAKAAATGIQMGLNWASDQAHLDLQKQVLEQQKDQHDELKRQFQFKVTTQNSEYENAIAKAPPGSDYQKALAENYRNYLTNSKQPIDESRMSILTSKKVEDEEFRQNLMKLYAAIPGVDPKVVPDVADALIFGMKHDPSSPDSMKNVTDTLEKVLVAKQTSQMKAQNLEFRETKTAQQQYDTIQKPTNIVLGAALRFKNLLKQGMQKDGSFVITPQLSKTLTNEKLKMELGGQSALDDREGQAYKNSATLFGELLQKATASPQGVLTKPVATQLLGEVNEMTSTAMNQHDNLSNQILGGATPTEANAIKGRAAAFRSTYASKKTGFGQWGEQPKSKEELNGSEEEKPKESTTDANKLAAEKKAAAAFKSKLKVMPQPGPARDSLLESLANIPAETRAKYGLPTDAAIKALKNAGAQ